MKVVLLMAFSDLLRDVLKVIAILAAPQVLYYDRLCFEVPDTDPQALEQDGSQWIARGGWCDLRSCGVNNRSRDMKQLRKP